VRPVAVSAPAVELSVRLGRIAYGQVVKGVAVQAGEREAGDPLEDDVAGVLGDAVRHEVRASDRCERARPCEIARRVRGQPAPPRAQPGGGRVVQGDWVTTMTLLTTVYWCACLLSDTCM